MMKNIIHIHNNEYKMSLIYETLNYINLSTNTTYGILSAIEKHSSQTGIIVKVFDVQWKKYKLLTEEYPLNA
jgi:predicted nucleic-acid-binding Zn-ribbon protein